MGYWGLVSLADLLPGRGYQLSSYPQRGPPGVFLDELKEEIRACVSVLNTPPWAG